MKFYVYAHKDLNGNIFYVGKGTKVRMTRLLKEGHYNSRSVQYLEKVKELNFEYTYEILAECSTNLEAEKLEKEYFDLLSKTCILTNKNRPSSTKEICFEQMNNLLYYDETSPSGLRNKIEIRSGKNQNVIRKRVGDIAGTLNSAGYYIINIKATLYLAHRIIYLLHYGEIDSSLVVDHIDRNSQNNNIDNLRSVTQKTNTLNLSLKSNNKSGINGVMHDPQRNRFRAYITKDGKQVSKTFSIKIYGFEKAKQLATEARDELLLLIKDQSYHEFP